jgi:hypothetical protein
MSTIQATNIKSAASASNNIVLDASGNATFAGTAAMGSSFLRNRIINGDMRIDQRNNGASVTSGFPVDRFQVYSTQSGKWSAQRSTTAPAGFTNSVIVTSSSAYSPVASDYFSVATRIEGYNTDDLGWGTAGAKTITVSFWVRSSLTGTWTGALHNNAFNRVYPFSYSISTANTWEYKTVTIVGDTSGTWLTDNLVGIEIGFAFSVGSSGLATAGSWSSTSNIFGATGQTNLLGTNGATFYLTGVQLEVGTVATPFERRQFGQELFLCQRYFQRFSAFCGSNFDSFLSYFGGTGTPSATQIFPVQMRATPTGSFSISTVEYYSYAGVWTSTTLVAFPLDAQRFYFWCLTDGDGRGKLMRNSGNNVANQPYVSWAAEL